MCPDQKVVVLFFCINFIFIICSTVAQIWMKNKHYQKLIENEANLLIVIQSKQLVIDAYKQLEKQRKENGQN